MAETAARRREPTGRVGLVLNPTSGKGRGAKVRARVLDGLRAAGLDPVDLSGPDLDTATARARAGLAQGIDALVVVGGDGMVHLGANVVAGTGVPLGIVAVGTGNDVARDLGLPVHDVAASLALVPDALAAHDGTDGGGDGAGDGARDRAGVRLVDAVAVSRPGGPTEHWFMAVLSCGLDAAVNDRANRMTWPADGGRYVRALLAELGGYVPYGYRVTMDGRVWEGDGTLVAVANTRSFGGGLLIAPGAEPDDGMLDVVIADGLSRSRLLRLFPRLYRGTHVTDPAVHVHRARSVLIEPLLARGAAPPVAFGDGERLDALPLQCDLHPRAVGVLARTLGA
ncbi:diacylglycerol kinase family lipid kinase [Georgenia sp. EYE_87]|uniref:diacylglycerol/lipid kinase family protein n=1 Tax=Georgenia sp. EYE_87 TaxID=2853448 RepID=UPI002002AE9A|nr:diacylglycerol kinase family protein [Georgenia sp. EYE_87]MCK6209166.1 diacylglycerol kinase family lipid kinase [Georgenia sp. EYE_87]